VTPGAGELEQLLRGLLERKIQSVFVEGGAAVINAFLQSGLWDEIRRCQGPTVIGDGVKAPVTTGILRSFEKVENDLWTYYTRN
jgi:diaminohydroxyphosphoribosylaminopyrimidine deaminase/5-amino-6-(5-phosphoribosylamino)uracil reductase